MKRTSTWLSATLLALMGCNDVRGTDQGGGGNGGGEGGTGGAPDVVPTCTTQPASSTPSCSGCNLALDVEIRCGDTDFGQAGVSLALTGTKTYLATANQDRARVFDVAKADARLVPADIDARPVAVAVADDGTLAVVGDETQAPAYEGGLVALIGPPDALVKVPLADNPDRFTSFENIAMTPDGVLHAWFFSSFVETPPQSVYGEAIVDRSRAVRTVDAPVPGISGWDAFGLDTLGRSVAYEVSPEPYTVRALVDGETRTLGAPVSGFFVDYKVAAAPRPASGNTVPYAVAILDDPGIRLAFPSDATSKDVALTGTAAWIGTCADGIFPRPPEGCGGTCEERAVGVERRAYAAALLPNDEVAVAYVVKHAHFTTVLVDDMADGPVCRSEVRDDQSTYELVVARVPLTGGAPQELVRADVPALAWLNFFGDDTSDIVDVRTHGSDIAVALRVVDGDKAKLRVLRLAAAVGN